MFVLAQFHVIPCSLVGIPGRKVPFSHFNALSVQHKDMIRTTVQEIPVVGYEDKAFLERKIVSDFLPGGPIQMVCGLIDQEKGVLL